MASQYEGEKDGIISECERCKGLQMVQFECSRHWKSPLSSNSGVGGIPFSPILALWRNKILPPWMNMKIPSQNDYRRQLLVQLEYPRHHYPIYFLLFSRKFNISSILDIGAHGNGNANILSAFRAATFRYIGLHGSLFAKPATFHLLG